MRPRLINSLAEFAGPVTPEVAGTKEESGTKFTKISRVYSVLFNSTMRKVRAAEGKVHARAALGTFSAA
jgi:hypothetical protein